MHLLMILTLAAAAHAPASPSGWNRYSNGRFGYSVCYPPLLKPQREADNGDGRKFSGPHGSSVAVWGGWDALEHGLTGEAQMTVEGFSDGHGQVTYKVVKKDWFVVSGRVGDKLVYERTWKIKDAFEGIRFEYTQADQPLFTGLISQMTACFNLGYPDY